MKIAATPFAVSLWLLPPAPDQTKIREQIRRLAEEVQEERDGSRGAGSGSSRGVLFEPHVTVVGGVPCESMDDARAKLRRLDRLKGFGRVPCSFGSKAFLVGDGGVPVWNQAAVLVMEEESEEFLRLCRRASELLLGDEWTFAPPLRKPHLSLYYGTVDVPAESEVEVVPPFEAEQVALWKTYPGGVDGVRDWELIGTVDLFADDDDDDDDDSTSAQ